VIESDKQDIHNYSKWTCAISELEAWIKHTSNCLIMSGF